MNADLLEASSPASRLLRTFVRFDARRRQTGVLQQPASAARRGPRRTPRAFAALALAALATTAALGCDPFRPTYAGLTCGPAEDCPGGFSCIEGVCLSEAALCGNGVIDTGEQCDDGNDVEGDGCNASCAGASCYVPVTHASITEGVADATCATAYVHGGTHTGSLILSRNVELVGVGSTPSVLDGGAAGTVVTVPSGITATLRKLTVQNGRAALGGGISNSGTLTLDSVVVTENTASAESPNGGGIANLSGTLTLTNSQVTKNHLASSSAGGATGPALTGAGIYSGGGSVRLEGGSLVESNDITATIPGAIARGAGISATTTAVTLTAASFVRGNVIALDGGVGRATATGGGIYLNGGSLRLEGASGIDGNSATARGTDANSNIGANARGGGLYSMTAMLSFDNAFLRNNKALAEGPRQTAAIAGGAAVFSNTMIVNMTEITGNTATANGLTAGALSAIAEVGGLDLENVSGTFTGTAISNNSAVANTPDTVAAGTAGNAATGGMRTTVFGNSVQAVALVRCTIDSNKAISLDGAAFRGGLHFDVTGSAGATTTLNARLSETTVSNNVARGAVSAQTGGLDAISVNGTAALNLAIVNSTISGNNADSATGTASIGALRLNAGTGTNNKLDVIIASSTVTRNVASGANNAAGGIDLGRTGGAFNFTFKTSILGENTATASPNCRASMATFGANSSYNVLSTVDGCTFSGTPPGNQVPVAALGLGPLANNGGPTRTHAVQAGSPAHNKGNPDGCTDHLVPPQLLATDQRGMNRSVGICDVGAYEAQ